MAEVKNVTFGKPKIGGAVFSAPVGTALPTDAKTELDGAFKALGYVSNEGVSNENKIDTENIKAWGGDTVLVVQKGKEDTFKYTLIEVLNVDVLKEVFGADNVTGNIENGLKIVANSKPLDTHTVVIELILRNNILKRIVIPNAMVSEIGDINYKDDEAVGYEITLVATPDASGNTHYEYMSKGTNV